MATFATCYELISSREKSNSTAHPRASRAVGTRGFFTGNLGADLSTDPIEVGLIRPSAWVVDVPATRCPYRSFSGIGPGTVNQYLRWEYGQPASSPTDFYIEDGTPVQLVSGGPAMHFSTVSEGRLSPRPQFAKVDQNNSVGVAGTLIWSNEVNYASDRNVVLFNDVPPASAVNGGGYPLALLNSLSVGAQVSITTSAGDVIPYCAAIGIAPEGRIWVDPGDIGGAANQIPDSVADNTAAKFMNHPSVFIPAGSGKYIRGLDRRVIDSNSINETTVGQPLVITPVESEVTRSTWLVAIDGADVILTLQHPSGTDYRRPRDIWTNVIAPMLTGQQIASTLGFSASEALSVQRTLRYSHYWRILSTDGDGGDITQDDTTPPA